MKLKAIPALVLALAFLHLGGPQPARAQQNQTTYTLASFPAPPGPGFSYASSLLQGSDGNFYGTHNEIIPITIGGLTTYTYTGTVFRVAPDGTLTTVATIPTLERSENRLGFGPYSSLVQDANGNFYGTTYVHGATRDTLAGMIYKLTPDGNLSTLYYFSGGPDGGKPHGDLITGADGNFYGTTSAGGASGKGTIFSITPDGAFTSLYSFTGGSDGANPFAPLLLASDGNFYGTTTAGGANGGGTVFQMMPGGLLTPLFSFAASDGNSPYAGLVQGLDGNFYGRTVNPAAMRGGGTIFKLAPDGNLTTLFTFPNGTDDGISSVALGQGKDGRFYGTTGSGGTSRTGTVFAITPDGALTTLYSFSGLSAGTNADGAVPVASLIQAPDGNFYGTTSNGGANKTGTVFAIAQLATLTTLSVFDGSAGYNPLSILQGQDGNFYGVTSNSPAGIGAGTVFVVPPTGGTPTTLHTFAFLTRPNNGLIQASDANLYGTTSQGGAFGRGFVYRMALDGTTTVLYSFTGGNDGTNPAGGVIQALDGNFYGTASGGGSTGGGTVFQLTPDGTLTVLRTFTGGPPNGDGYAPVAALLQASDGNFYGTASRGGATAQVGGTVFRLDDPGTLHKFDPNTEGPTPVTSLVEAPDGQLWGTTFGQFQRGGIYRISKDGTLYKIIHRDNNSDGNNSVAGLILASDGNFYGILGPGGSTIAGAGIIFEITPNGIFLVLHRFSGPDGAGPYNGALVEGTDGFLYGVTGSGGQFDKGTFFRLDRGR